MKGKGEGKKTVHVTLLRLVNTLNWIAFLNMGEGKGGGEEKEKGMPLLPP